MRKGTKKFYLAAATIFMVTITTSIYLYATSGGRTGQTQKSTQAGCGPAGCHSVNATTSLGVSINGPSSLTRSQTVQFTVTVSGSTGAGGGVNIAVSSGTLVQPAASSNLQLLNGELTHKSGQTMPITYTFSYTAPAAPGTVTMYAVAKGAGFSTWNWAANKVISVVPPTAVADGNNPASPAGFVLEPNFPNPFRSSGASPVQSRGNSATQISYTLPENSAVTLQIYDALGHLVKTLVQARQSAGRHTATWNGHDEAGNPMAGGIYFYILATEKMRLSRKMILMH